MYPTNNRQAYILITMILLSLGLPQAFGKNLHLIERLPNGFHIYRSGVPSNADLKEYGKLGIQEIAVLSGDAKRHELKNADLAPGLMVPEREPTYLHSSPHTRPESGLDLSQRQLRAHS